MITSMENQQVKEARKLQRRRYRERSGTLLIEGLRLVRDALQSGVQIEKLFYAPTMVAGNQPLLELIDHCGAANIPLLACTDEVFVTLAETVTPQGIAAVTALPVLPLPIPCHFTLILDQVRDPGNAGTLVRTAEAVGIDAVFFGPDTVDPFNDKVVRAGMGGHFRLPIRNYATWSAIQPLLDPAQVLYLAQANAPQRYTEVDWCRPSALIVGGEAAGASADAMSLARPIAIPMHGQVESLNAAIAGAVILFEAARQRRLS
ncbi:MAG TPA: RNA methyltransferase [Caldilineaceae bacterium]|nr:RNA methyltransferase [Caldilineaceae bacterium]